MSVNMNWIMLHAPAAADIKKICKKYALDEDAVQDALDPDELSRTSTFPAYTMVIIRVPVKKSNLEYRAIPVGIFIPAGERDTIITVCLAQDDVFSKMKGAIESIKSSQEFVLNLLSFTAISYIKHLKDIDKMSAEMQRALEESVNNKCLVTLFALEKSLVYFTTALKSNQILLKKFRTKTVYSTSLIEEAGIDNEQALSMAETNADILAGMLDAYAGCIGNNLNLRIKTMTFISLILMIPTLIASFFGMNTKFPSWTSSPVSTLLIIIFALLIAGAAWLIFGKKKI
jgi:magnesium transporter